MSSKLPPPEVEAFLSAHLGSEVGGVEPLAGGHWSQAFAFRAEDRDWVARFGQYVEDFKKDQVAGAFRGANLPVPSVTHIGSAFDGYVCISERVFGEMIDEAGSDQWATLVPAVLRALDAMRDADVSVWTDAVGAPAKGWREQLLSVDEENDRVFGWHDRMAESPTGPDHYQAALTFLKERVDDLPEMRHLLHNDLLHDNVMVSGPKITGVFDWGNAGLGDFLYELAMFTFYAPWYPAMEGIDWRTMAQRHYEEIGLDVPNLDFRLRCYEVHLGLAGMAYNAFTQNWKELANNAHNTMQRLSS